MSKIVAVEAIHIRIPLPRDFRGSIYSVPEKNAIITRVVADDGAVGEAINGEGNAEVHAQIARVIRRDLAPLVTGDDPDLIEAIWQKAWRLTHVGVRDRRAEVRAVACLDSALWDMKAKRAGMPLWKMWGGAQARLPIIAIGGQYHEDDRLDDCSEEMAFFRDLGLAGCKFKIGGRSPQFDTERTRAARAGGGEDFILCVDANRGWSRADAIDYVQRIAPLGLNIRWFEEPCHWQDEKRDMAMVRMMSRLPVVAGQSEMTAQGCRDLMRENAIDICNLDASWGGGPTAWLRVAHMAECFGLQMAHHGEPVVGSHLLAAVPNGTYVETHHPDRDPVFHKMIAGRGRIADGFYELPTTPGWGVTFDPEMVRHYTAQ